ncbi:MAG TPA: hypothetical protein VH044_05560 [Polyangiaceae bacterium]|nr:hypothetical protein [Polyangiaceae bacterium]
MRAVLAARLSRALRPVLRCLPALVPLVLALPLASGCGASTIRVVGVMQQSSEMRPLPSVPLGGYQQLHLFVRAAPGQSADKYGSPDCGFTRLEGTSEGDQLNNTACVPVDALNTAIGIVRQRLRAYGIDVVRDANDPYDYKVEVWVTGEAPHRPDRTEVKAVAQVNFKLHDDPTSKTLVNTLDPRAAGVAFDAVSKTCGFRDGDFTHFSASSRQPMTPDFDIVALASDAVDNALRCEDLAGFFLDAKTRFPKPVTPAPATPVQLPPN